MLFAAADCIDPLIHVEDACVVLEVILAVLV